jgi:hypothetical protein
MQFTRGISMKKHFRRLVRCMGLLIVYCAVAQAQWIQTNGPRWTGEILSFGASGNVILARSADNGLFRSTDDGANWTAVNSGFSLIWACAINDGVLFASTLGGLFRSTNDGASWTAVNFSSAGSAYALLACGVGLFAGNDGTVFRSVDNGDSWVACLNSGQLSSILENGSSLYAGISGGGVFLSADSGLSWTPVNSGLADLNVECLAAGDRAIFAGTESGVFRSMDNGSSWTAINSGLANTSVLALAVNGTALFAGTDGGVFRSMSEGENWTAVNRGLPRIRSLVVHGGVLIAGTDGYGVFRSTDNGANWIATNCSSRSNITVSGLLGVGGKLLAMTGDVFMSADNGSHWTEAISSLLNDTGNAYPSWVLPQGHPLFAWDGEQSIVISSEAAASFHLDSGIITHVYDEWRLVPISFASNGNNFFVGTNQGVVRSTDAGANWIAPDSAFQKYTICSLLSKSGAVVAGSNGGVFVSTNSGTTWARAAFGLTNMRVLALASCKGALFAASTYGGVFSSTDNAATWTEVNSGLANTDVFALVSNDSALFAGTYGSGVFISTDNGGSWNAFNTGFPDMRVLSLAINSGVVYAGTEDHGLWSRPLSQVAVISGHPPRQEGLDQLHFNLRAPSPTNSCLTMAFSLPYPEHVVIALYGLSGKLMAAIVDKRLGAGSYSFQWDTRTMARGCYAVRMLKGNNSVTRLIHLTR